MKFLGEDCAVQSKFRNLESSSSSCSSSISRRFLEQKELAYPTIILPVSLIVKLGILEDEGRRAELLSVTY